ncbi:MAG: hypothetical protein H7Y04_03980 [Verrucomicrobia bacterium]|nr:hypothetical protein [Cytophagales bacterium]
MKNYHWIYSFIILLVAMPVLAQKNTDDQKSITIHIETKAKGEKKVFDKTYKGEEINREAILEDIKDYLPESERRHFFDKNGHFDMDTLLKIYPKSRLYQFKLDELQRRQPKLFYHFEDMHTLTFRSDSVNREKYKTMFKKIKPLKGDYFYEDTERTFSEEDYEIIVQKEKDGKKIVTIRKKK